MIIISDVHGCLKTLEALIAKLPKDEPIVFTGDLVDRGPRSREVVKFVRDNGYLCVKGNHEVMTVDMDDNWGHNGADKTLESYEIEYSVRFSRPVHVDPDSEQDPEKLKVFKDDQEWMSKLPLYLLFDDVQNDLGEKLLVTHSSAERVWGWSEEKRKEHKYHFETNIIWERNYNPDKIPGIYNVFGHTPVKEPKIRDGYAFIDTGAVFNEPPYNKLTALRFPQMEIYQQENLDY